MSEDLDNLEIGDIEWNEELEGEATVGKAEVSKFPVENSQRVFRIKELDINTIRPVNISDKGAKYAVIGKPGTGKSTLIKTLLYYKKHIIPTIKVHSGTEEDTGDYMKFIPSLFIDTDLKLQAIADLKKRKKYAIQYLDNPWVANVLDDVTSDPKLFNKEIFLDYYKNGRHWKLFSVIALQYCMDIKPSLRTCIDGAFILRETNKRNRESLYTNYAGCIPTFQDFNDIMDQITDNYTALFINNMTQSNKIEDMVFYYKPDINRIPLDWKFGCEEIWDCNEQRLDPNYTDLTIV
jgi:energy-coupling factor transporter ATP-binding protein EcfA2